MSDELRDADYAQLLRVRTALRHFLSWSAQRAKDAGLTPMQHQLLLAVRGHDGVPTVGDIAAYLLLRHHSAVELIDRAEAAGLVTRHVDADDSRIVRVKLTRGGRRRLASLAAQHQAELRRLLTTDTRLWEGLSADGS